MFRSLRIAALLAGALLAFPALAQDAYGGNADVDPPGRVARLSYIQGAVSFVPAGENDWVEAQLNRPLITGDKLYTDRDSRAALEIGASAVRMDGGTSFDFLNLDDNHAQMELTQGTLNLRVRRLYDGQSYEIDTPTLAFVVNRVGMFRIDVDPDGRSTTVTVISGGGDVYGENEARFSVDEGQSVVFHDPSLRDYEIDRLPRPDSFDDFCHARDTRWDNSPSRRYVSEEVIGYQDLDNYGQWNDVPEYGNVWYPTSVAVGWTPYHHGHWAWVGAYGWTWIDDSPWGFAPFHYGRWAYIGNRWGWCPGPIAVRPVYAPALVAFVGGFRGGLSISVGGPIGWFPLGPRDVYFPSYHVSHGYFSRVNVSNTVINTTVINNYYGNYSRNAVDYSRISYANRNIAGAVTAVPAAAFVNARPVARAALQVNRAEFAQAKVHGFAAVAPTRASLVPMTAARAVPKTAVVSRPVVAATRPPAPVASFANRQSLLEKNPGRPLNERVLRATPVVARPGTDKAAPHAIAERPNVRVVTPKGAPTRVQAPALPARGTAINRGADIDANRKATPVTRGDGKPAVLAPQRPTAPVRGNDKPDASAAQRPTVPARTVGPRAPHERPQVQGDATRHLDSSRFAHPQNGQPERGATPPREETRSPATPVRQAPQRNDRQEYARPVQQAPQRNERQEYARPVQQAPQRSERQEYSRPVQQAPQHQEYQRPVQQAPQRQEYQRPTQQPARSAPQPAQRQQRQEHRNKDDDDDNNRHRNRS